MQQALNDIHNGVHLGSFRRVPSVCGSVSDIESSFKNLYVFSSNKTRILKLLEFLFERSYVPTFSTISISSNVRAPIIGRLRLSASREWKPHPEQPSGSEEFSKSTEVDVWREEEGKAEHRGLGLPTTNAFV